MGKVTQVVPHLSEEEIKEKIKKTIGFWRVQKWLVIYNALVDPRSAKDIAKHTGLAVGTVHNIICEYNKHGPKAIETPGKGGRRKSYLSLEEEVKFLESFREKAAKGQVVTVKETKEAYEALVNKRVNKTTIYRLLSRHGWRKISPRPYHKGRDIRDQEDFKKTSDKEC